MLEGVQRTALLSMTGGVNSTPTAGMKMLLKIMPIVLFLKIILTETD